MSNKRHHKTFPAKDEVRRSIAARSGEYLRHAFRREKQDYAVRVVADAIGIHYRTVENWFEGRHAPSAEGMALLDRMFPGFMAWVTDITEPPPSKLAELEAELRDLRGEE